MNIETKWNIGDKLWFLNRDNGKFEQGTVRAISIFINSYQTRKLVNEEIITDKLITSNFTPQYYLSADGKESYTNLQNEYKIFQTKEDIIKYYEENSHELPLITT